MHGHRSRLMLARWIALGILLFAAELSTRACTAAEAPRAVRFRVEWGGGPARLWSGLIEGGNARLENPSSLGVEADEPGTIWSEGKNLWMRRRSIGVYDGFDVTAIGDPDSKITFTLQSEDPNDHGELEPQRHQIEFRLGEISAEPRVYSLTGETRLALRRTPGDNLRIQIDRPHLVFAPGETFVGQINGNLANESRNASGTLTWELRRARTNSILRDGTRNISTIDRDAKPESVSIPLPEAEGVYDIRFTLAGRGHGDEKTTIQVVVLSDKPLRRTSGATDGKLVDSFVPSRAGLFRRVEHRSGVRSVNNSLGRVFRFATPAATDSAEAQNSSRVHWQAYRLQVKNPETPHRLVVTLPANRRQSVGISVMEPNAAGQLMPPCLDSGIAVRGNNDVDGRGSADGQSVTHEILFWPRVKEPIVLLHDLGVGRQFEVSKVELIEQAGFNLATESIPAPNPTRLIGPHLSKPYFPENFGATEAFDAQSRRSLDDWESFRTGSERLMQYLKHEGFNSLLLAAFADGSTIYPSRVLEPTPRYDTGVYFSTGQDPVRKDVLELLYRMFDREGLVLIPELQFHSPLPTLEKLIARGHEEDRGIELIGSNGRSYREIRGASRGLAPYYNPLHPRVQEAILDVVQEVVTRYRHHSAFQGIAVQLGNSSYVQFPGLEWGYDDETIARFERGTGIQVPTTPGRDRFEERYGFLTGPERNRWIQWRCNEIAQFHRRLADVVASAGPNTKLIFSGTPATSNNPSENAPGALGAADSAEGLLAMGLDFKMQSDASRLVVLRPWCWSTPENPWENFADEQANHSEAFDAAFAGSQPGALFIRRPREVRISEFDSISPWQPAFTWLAAQVSPAGPDVREPYVQALARSDAQFLFDGGWSLSLGQEFETREMRSLFRALPAVPFHLAEKQQQPAAVRLARHNDQTWCYVVNDSREAIDVSLAWSCAATTRCRLIPDGSPHEFDADENGKGCSRISLKPYGIAALVVDDAVARIVDVQAHLPADAIASLDGRVQEFRRHIETACKSIPPESRQAASLLANPGFERTAAESKGLPGWEPPVETAALWALDGENPRSGKSSLMLAADGGDGASLSSPVPLEGNRLVSLAVWLRSDRDDADVKLIFEATLGREVFRQQSEIRVDSAWRRYQMQVTDIPPRPWESARVRVEMQGQGKIWIDDVDIQARKLSQDDVRQLTRIYSAITLAWEEKRYSDCARMLEGYWAKILEHASEPAADAPKELAPKREASRLRSIFQR